MTHLLELLERVDGCEQVVHVNFMPPGPKLAAQMRTMRRIFPTSAASWRSSSKCSVYPVLTSLIE